LACHRRRCHLGGVGGWSAGGFAAGLAFGVDVCHVAYAAAPRWQVVACGDRGVRLSNAVRLGWHDGFGNVRLLLDQRLGVEIQWKVLSRRILVV
jgi:hypothetical protein